MKIKLHNLLNDDFTNGFEFDKEYTVNKVEICGDYCAYDVWYYITNEYNNTTCFQDLNVEEIDTDKRLDKFIENFNKFQKTMGDLPYKFEFKIDLD